MVNWGRYVAATSSADTSWQAPWRIVLIDIDPRTAGASEAALARAISPCDACAMNLKPEKTPEMSPRQRRNGLTWFVLVTWGDWPSEEVGGFASEVDARTWIDRDSAAWLSSRFAEPPFA